MKRTITLAAALLLLLAAAHSAMGQLPCSDPNLVAFTFDTEASEVNLEGAAPYSTNQIYAFILNPSPQSLFGFEFSYETTPNALVLPVQFANPQALNVGDNQNLIVGLGAPSHSSGEPLLLATISLLYTDTTGGPVTITLGPSDPASVPGQMTMLGPNGELFPLHPVSGSFNLPIAQINGGSPIVHCQDPWTPNGLTVGITSQGDEDNLVGTDTRATDGYDYPFDLLEDEGDEPVFCYRPDWSVHGGTRYKQDIIADFDPHLETRTWAFTVESVVPAGQEVPYPITLEFAPSFAADPEVIMTLVDTYTGDITIIDDPWTYEYLITEQEARTFELTVGNDTVYPPTPIIELRVDAAIADFADTGNYARALDEATDDFDPGLDVPEPGPPPGEYIAASFHQPDWPFGPRFRTMVHGPFDPTQDYKEWPLRVETDQVGLVELSFTPDFAPGEGIVLYLHDETTGLYTDLLANPVFGYQNDNPSVRDFTILMGNVGPPPAPSVPALLRDGWNLIGMPLVPDPAHDTLADVLLDDAPTPHYVFRYDNPGGYLEEAGTSTAEQGRGYWIALDQNHNWSMEGTRDLDPISIDLAEGWNLISYPLWFDGSLDRTMVLHDGNELTWNQAVDQGLILGNAVGFRSYDQQYVDADILRIYNGYWMAALQPGVSLVFEWTNYLNLPWEQGPARDFTPDQIWRTEVTAQAAGEQLRLEFGVHPEAGAGFDPALDLPRTPASPDVSGFMGVLREQWQLPTGDLMMRDLVDPADAPLSWDALIVPGRPGAVTLSWDRVDWPAGLDLQIYLPRDNRVLVPSMKKTNSLRLDLSAGSEVIRFRTPELSGVGDTPALAFSVDAHPNPFNPQTTVGFTLARAGDAQIRIYDLRGGHLRTLHVDAAPAGRHELVWNGRDRAGREAPSGAYLAKLYLDGEDVGPVARLLLVR